MLMNFLKKSFDIFDALNVIDIFFFSIAFRIKIKSLTEFIEVFFCQTCVRFVLQFSEHNHNLIPHLLTKNCTMMIQQEQSKNLPFLNYLVVFEQLQ